MQWFLKEQVEEVAQMTTLLNVVRRANGNLFDVENFLAREAVGDGGADPLAPNAAGGLL
jgi:ferritin